MKKSTAHLLLYITCIITLISIACAQTELPNTTHICKDQTHQTCDGNCVCDGMECPPIEESLEYGLILNKDYTITIVELSTHRVYISNADSLGYHINKLQE